MYKTKQSVISPPARSRNIFYDLGYFFLKKPKKETLIRFSSEGERQNYNDRIRQRLGINPDRFSILNIHRIGVNAPVNYMFNEILNWNGDSTCWPNHTAKVDRIKNRLEDIRILFLGIKFLPLFLLKSRKFKKTPDRFDFDNARYLLYECSGGYPIGIFSMYVRSPIASLSEIAQAQLFIIVGFNFYGKERLGRKGLINKIWLSIHNRVTTHVLIRMKQLAEWRFEKMQDHIS